MRTALGHTSALALVAVAGLTAIAAREQIPPWEAANPVRPLPHSPLGIDSKLTDLTSAPTPQRVRLGRWLFYDKRLSADATIACATCHRPEHVFSEPTPVSTGIRGQKGSRRAGRTSRTVRSTISESAGTRKAEHSLTRAATWSRKPGTNRGAFKTPTLREVGLHPPYMHDGSLTTLREVVQHYNKGGNQNPHLDPKIQPLKLTEDEITALVKFMEALKGEGYQDKPPAVFPK
jgi:cytochrome c peroxidase